MSGKIVKPEDLNGVMEMGRVVYVYGDGTVDYGFEHAPLLPDFYVDSDGKDTVESNGAEWTFLSGYTGQYSYNGPVMHVSEYIGAGMARDILEAPGWYAAIEVKDGDTWEYPDGDPIGWVVAHIAE